jgi:hypothetical protein
MQDAGCRMQDAGCRMKDAGCSRRAHDYIRHPTFDILHPGGVDPDHGLLKADTTARC